MSMVRQAHHEWFGKLTMIVLSLSKDDWLTMFILILSRDECEVSSETLNCAWRAIPRLQEHFGV
jgi:hypothetical protein